MLLRKIMFENFGILEHSEICFNKHFNILTGPNGTGKTTVVEAIRIAKALINVMGVPGLSSTVTSGATGNTKIGFVFKDFTFSLEWNKEGNVKEWALSDTLSFNDARALFKHWLNQIVFINPDNNEQITSIFMGFPYNPILKGDILKTIQRFYPSLTDIFYDEGTLACSYTERGIDDIFEISEDKASKLRKIIAFSCLIHTKSEGFFVFTELDEGIDYRNHHGFVEELTWFCKEQKNQVLMVTHSTFTVSATDPKNVNITRRPGKSAEIVMLMDIIGNKDDVDVIQEIYEDWYRDIVYSIPNGIDTFQ